MKTRRLALAAVVCALAAVSVVRGADLTLRYDAPAPMTPQGWERHSLPVGNGRVGGNFFGGLGMERLLYNEITLWTGNEAVKGSFQAFGNLDITLPGHDAGGTGGGTGAATGYRRELDLERGVGRVQYVKEGVTYTREFFASYPAQVVVVRLTADRPGAYTGTIKLTDAHNAPTKAEGNVLTATGVLGGGRGAASAPAAAPAAPAARGMAFESQAGVLHEGGKLTVTGDTIAFEGCNSVTVVLAAGTDYVFDYGRKYLGEHPHARVTAQLRAAMAKSPGALWEEHLKDYQRLFGRVALNLGQSTPERLAMPTDKRLEAYTADGKDPGLEAMFFQYGRYLLISSSRGSLPANLQGLWTGNNNPPWGADYHTNINIQMNYWPAEPANLSELHQPLFDFVVAQIPAYRKIVADTAARAAANPPATAPARGRGRGAPEETFLTKDGKPVRGWTVRTESTPFGYLSFTWNKTGNAWYAQHFWEHYAFTLDKEFLQNVAYPMMKEVCHFWEDYLQELPDGRLVAPLGWSPEHGPIEDGVSYDQELIWDLFDNTVKAADVLGTDKAFRDKIAAMRDKLAKPGIGSWGQLLEWMEEKKSDPSLDKPTNKHRHVSHLFGLYPGHQISTLTPEWLEAAKVTLKARGDAGTGWSMAWKISFWARLLDGDYALKMLRGQLAVPGWAARQAGIPGSFDSAGGTFPNLWDAHPPFQIDGNFGATAAICEMLLQSHTGEIHLLPALPGAWAAGSVKGLRARGAFEVDEAWSGGKLTGVTVRSDKGGTAKIRYGEARVEVPLKAGESVTLDGELKRKP